MYRHDLSNEELLALKRKHERRMICIEDANEEEWIEDKYAG